MSLSPCPNDQKLCSAQKVILLLFVSLACMCMGVHVCVNTCVCMNVCMLVCACMWVCVCVCMHRVCAWVCGCVCMHGWVCMGAYVYVMCGLLHLLQLLTQLWVELFFFLSKRHKNVLPAEEYDTNNLRREHPLTAYTSL